MKVSATVGIIIFAVSLIIAAFFLFFVLRYFNRYPSDSIIENSFYSNFEAFEKIKDKALLESEYSSNRHIGGKTYNIHRMKRKYGEDNDNDEVSFYYEKSVASGIIGMCSEKGLMYTTDEIENVVSGELSLDLPQQSYGLNFKKTRFENWYLFIINTCG